MHELILASRSPRRRDLLKLIGHPFTSTEADVEEIALPNEPPDSQVTRLAALKAATIAATRSSGIVIGSDTLVVIDGDVLGKPVSFEDALGMLLRLQGRTHEVYTGFALHDSATGHSMVDYEISRVTMRPFSEALARDYLATGEPFDKAGSYGIQGYGAVLITGVQGCYFNVMGLPLARLMQALDDFTGGHIGFFGKHGETQA